MPNTPETIGDAEAAGYQVQATCRSCGLVVCTDLPALRAGGYANLSLFELAPKLFCVSCGRSAMQLALIKS